MTEPTIDVLVIGAGLAGLSAAATAARAGARVVVLDGRPAGGRARTDVRDGFRFNTGPRGFYMAGPGAAALRDLGIDPAGGEPSTKGFRIIDGERSVAMTGAAGSVRATASLMSALARIGTGRAAGRPDQSTEAWIRSLTASEGARTMLRVLVRTATYSADLGTLSADAGAEQVRLALRPKGVRYLDGGWSTLVDALASVVTTAGGTIEAGRPVTALTFGPADTSIVVRTPTGELSARSVVVAAGGPAEAIRLLGRNPWGTLGPDVLAACLDLGLRGPSPTPLAFGRTEPLYLSCHCPPADLAPAGRAVVHVARYGVRSAEVDRPELEDYARRCGVQDADIVTSRFLARMTVSYALPTPAGGGLPGRPAVAVPEQPGVFVAGDWVGPVGLLADAAIVSGLAAGRSAAAAGHLSAVGQR